jgi:hypothetical protein
MNQKIKAGVFTAGFGAICIATGLGIQYVAQFMTPKQFIMGVAVAGITACFYTIYSVLLAKFQYEEHLKSMVDRK